MPSDTCPYVLRAEISNPPGSTAPGSDTTTLSPASKLCAPQTMPRTPAPPSAAVRPSGATRTWHQFTVLPFECSSGSRESTSPTTTGPVTSKRRIDSSSKPTRTRSACTASGVTSSGSETTSPSQLSGTRIIPVLRTDG